METIDPSRTVADDLFGRFADRLANRRHAFLIGAGVSFPAGVPTVAPFRLKVLQGLGLSELDIVQYIKANVPFESFVEVLMGIADCTALLQLFRGQEPAIGHRVIARLAKWNLVNVIVTTNFDCLLEAALTMEGVSFDVLTSETAFGSVNWSSTRLLLIKIHGTIENLGDLAITIRKVAARQFADVRGKVMRELLTQNLEGGLIVLGYSCSDHFDISPAVRSAARRDHQVLYVAHDLSCESPVMKRLQDFQPINPFCGCDSTALVCNADRLFRAVAAKLPGDPIAEKRHQNSRIWEEGVERWLNQLEVGVPGGTRWHMLGLLLKSANLWNRANDHLFMALKDGVAESQVPRILLATGNNCRDSGKTNEGKAILRVALHEAHRVNDTGTEARIINTLGIIAEDARDHKTAIDLYTQALSGARAAHDRELEGKCHGNLAIALKNRATGDDLYLALGHHLVALDIAREIGDKRSEGRTLGNIGLVYRDLRDVRMACRYYEAARDVADLLGDSLHVGIWLHNMGEDIADHEPDRARECLESSAALFNDLGQVEFARESESVLEKLDQRAKQHIRDLNSRGSARGLTDS